MEGKPILRVVFLHRCVLLKLKQCHWLGTEGAEEAAEEEADQSSQSSQSLMAVDRSDHLASTDEVAESESSGERTEPPNSVGIIKLKYRYRCTVVPCGMLL